MRIPSWRGLAAAVLVLGASAGAADFRPTPQTRKDNRPVDLWQTYMHGIVDTFAEPLAPEFPKTTSETVTVERPHFRASFPAVKLGKETRTSSPVPFDFGKHAGKKVRFFYWMKGDNTGRQPTPQSWNDCPQFAVIIKNDKKKQIARIDSRNGAVGTFPWHGYYLDVQIPPAAKSVQFELKNHYNGSARFGRFACEPIGPENTYTVDERQDPDTGSNAAFPWYEPMNFHFIVKPGVGYKHVWNFLRGPAAGMIGQPYDLTTLDGLRRYYRESVKVDLDQMNHGIMYFGTRISGARRNNVLPPGMPDNYLDEVARIIIEDQDPETGYWGTQDTPLSMSATFHYVDMLFNFGVERTDMPAAQPAGNRCIASYLPRPEAMARTTLRLQSTYDNNGKTETAAWSQAAYNYTDNPDVNPSRAALGSTMNAIRLLRVCYRFVPPEMQADIDRSVEAAFKYVLVRCTTPEGLYMMSDDAKGPSRPAYFQNIVEFSRYLEKRTDPDLPPPETAAVPGGFRATAWKEGQNSLRFYAAPEGADPASLGNADLVAIVSRGDRTMIELDPLLAVRRCTEASAKNWGTAITPYTHYLKRKVFTELKADLPTAVGDQPVTFAPPSGKNLYVTAVDWYGRESTPVLLRQP